MAGLTGLEPATSCVTGGRKLLAYPAQVVYKKILSPAQFKRPLPVRVTQPKRARAIFLKWWSGTIRDGWRRQKPVWF